MVVNTCRRLPECLPIFANFFDPALRVLRVESMKSYCAIVGLLDNFFCLKRTREEIFLCC